ncbi:MAG TPA: hypothetical protein VNT79_13730 [Phycisphaerae bacterium]|nr:hypothetical protein [Phycisphaerae bacterium]
MSINLAAENGGPCYDAVVPRFLFHAHPADLEAEGLEGALSRLRGEIGMDGISVDAVAPARLVLRPRLVGSSRAPKAMPIVSNAAAAWFQPASRHYVNTRLRPNVAAEIKSRNLLARMCEDAAAGGLTVRAIVDPLDNATLASRHESAACIDVFGRPHESRLCPSQPEVREFAAALVEDISANLDVEAIELANVEFGAGLYAEHPPISGLPFGASEAALLGWCFCPACRQRAGEANVDADAAASEITQRIAAITELRSSARAEFAAIVVENTVLRAYSGIRAATVTSLLKLIRGRCGKPLVVRVSYDPLQSGQDLAAIRVHCDGFIWPGGRPEVCDRQSRVVEIAGGPQRVDMEICCHPPHMWDGPAMVATVHEAALAGYAAVRFSDYGLVPAPCLEWVRQAIRFARRSA